MKASVSKNLRMCPFSFTNEGFCESLLLKLCLVMFCPLSKPGMHITWFMCLLLIFNKLFSFIATWRFFLNLIFVPAMSLWLLILSFSFFYLNLCFVFYLLMLNKQIFWKEIKSDLQRKFFFWKSRKVSKDSSIFFSF